MNPVVTLPIRRFARTTAELLAYVLVLAAGFAIIIALDLSEMITAILVMAWLGVFFTGVFIRERGRDYIDLRKPTRRELVIMAIAIIGYYGILIVFSLGVSILGPGTEAAGHTALDHDQGPDYAIMLTVLAVFVGVPVEELIFRNGLQKGLTGRFGGPIAILATSVLFAAAHYWSYGAASEPIVGIGLSLLVVFANSVIMGVAYFKTENLMVPIAIHAAVNTVGIVLVFGGH